MDLEDARGLPVDLLQRHLTCGIHDPPCFTLVEVRTFVFPFSSIVTILTEKPTIF
jgi:hypothetical protein